MENAAKQNYPGSVNCYNTWPGREMGFVYNAPGPTWGNCFKCTQINNSYQILSNTTQYNM